jgi:hypothetical protein
MIGRNMKFQLVTFVFAGFLALPATVSAASPAESRGIPFSITDLGWLALGAMLLLLISLALQGIARHRRAAHRAAAVKVSPQRSEP